MNVVLYLRKAILCLSVSMYVPVCTAQTGNLPEPLKHPDHLITPYGHGLELVPTILPGKDMLSSIVLLGHGFYYSKYLGRDTDGSIIYGAPKYMDGISNLISDAQIIYIDDIPYFLGSNKENKGVWSVWDIDESVNDSLVLSDPLPIMVGGTPLKTSNFTIVKLNGRIIILKFERENSLDYWPNSTNPWVYPPNSDIGFDKGYDENGVWLGKKTEVTLSWAELIEGEKWEFDAWKAVYRNGEPFKLLNYSSQSKISPFKPEEELQLLVTANIDEFSLYAVELTDKTLSVSSQPLPAGIDQQIAEIYFSAPLSSTRPLYGSQNEGFMVGGNPGILIEYYRDGKLWKHRPVLMKGGYVHVQTLAVPQWVDWDNDGLPDIIAGDASGYLWFIKNIGTKKNAIWGKPEKLEAEGKIIHHQAGMTGSIQGPNERRWGYTQPLVCDWDGDGLLDIVCNDITGFHVLYKNIGTKKSPRLAAAVPLIYEGQPYKAAWRSKPAVLPDIFYRQKDTAYYLAVNGAGELCLYERDLSDPNRLKNEEVLKYNDGEPVRIVGFAGHEGRVTLDICDYNGDGIWDVIFGQGVHLAQSRVGPPTAVEYSTPYIMINSGTNEDPVFEFPQTICQSNGEVINLDRHGCWISPLLDKKARLKKLLIGGEDGHFYMFENPRICAMNE